MKASRIIIITAIAVVAVAALYGGFDLTSRDAVPGGEPSVIPETVADANNAFAIDFYKQVSSDGNVFFSPTSIYMAFSMLYEGARDDTAQQMQHVFGFEPDKTMRHEAVADALSSLNRDDPHATLEMANSLWFDKRFTPYDSYLDVARNTYFADVEALDFDDVQAAGRINDWADEKTHGKITKVLEEIDSDTVAILLNAIYFKGTWVTQFPTEDTRESEFWTGTQSINTDFMNVLGTFNYVARDGVQVLKLPYKGDRLSMLAVLPSDRDGIEQLEERLSAQLVREWQRDMAKTEVKVAIPKFEMKTSYNLIHSLKTLGMPDVFDKHTANLSGMADVSAQNLYVAGATQDAYVNVNEEGTEAAAVTAITVSTEEESSPPSFIADHPFIFIIQDDESGAILFMGKVTDPTA